MCRPVIFLGLTFNTQRFSLMCIIYSFCKNYAKKLWKDGICSRYIMLANYYFLPWLQSEPQLPVSQAQLLVNWSHFVGQTEGHSSHIQLTIVLKIYPRNYFDPHSKLKEI